MNVEVSIGEILDAIEKNIHPKVQTSFISHTEQGTGSCAVGEAALNLHVSYSGLARELEEIEIPAICITNLDDDAIRPCFEGDFDSSYITNLDKLIQGLSEGTPMPKNKIAQWVRDHIPAHILEELVVVSEAVPFQGGSETYEIAKTDNEFQPETCTV